jgi:hypothetical protein
MAAFDYEVDSFLWIGIEGLAVFGPERKWRFQDSVSVWRCDMDAERFLIVQLRDLFFEYVIVLFVGFAGLAGNV